MFLLNIHIS